MMSDCDCGGPALNGFKSGYAAGFDYRMRANAERTSLLPPPVLAALNLEEPPAADVGDGTDVFAFWRRYGWMTGYLDADGAIRAGNTR